MDQKPLNLVIKENFSLLSPGQKKVAEFFIQNVNEAALLTAYQVGKKVGVSETTVIRLAYALGFSGFSQLQEKLRKDWLVRKYPQSEDRPSNMEADSDSHLFTNVIDQERLILQQLLQQLNTNEVLRTAEEIIKADSIYIGGFGSTYGAAYWFYYTLKQFRGNVYLSSPTGFLAEDISDLTEQSVVIIFSFPRYRRESLKLVKIAAEQGSKIIAITNRQLSPIGQVSDITLTTEEQMESDHHSIASVITLLEVLIAAIHHQDIDRISIRQKKLEKVYTEQELFLE
ncbi:MurR/RpiR family transcriptional regulator [Neobacillus sp. DY30]|uniref:MurR/RpiR family transcriptional regulator n=1 Tax=Neobacillus sp. DY30 TaxID=3047871 RepID=UPI0024C0972E|nr:MurR/RpiR family transcriptional regulator [Neobacillus sp. DY30]WHX99904.1 MurR/RpiR family transcriptional regulator [Neobacillus sp. DY30]